MIYNEIGLFFVCNRSSPLLVWLYESENMLHFHSGQILMAAEMDFEPVCVLTRFPSDACFPTFSPLLLFYLCDFVMPLHRWSVFHHDILHIPSFKAVWFSGSTEKMFKCEWCRWLSAAGLGKIVAIHGRSPQTSGIS